MTLLEAAKSYALKGWPVLPLHGIVLDGDPYCTCNDDKCSSPGKHPYTKNGLDDATTDLNQITEWWERKWPFANVGLVTGVAFDVLDIDGEEGFDSITNWEVENGTLQPSATVKTGGDGYHYFFSPTGEGNRTAVLPKVDWRGARGYIVAPPSLHISGNRYSWFQAPRGDQFSPVPTEFLNRSKKERVRESAGKREGLSPSRYGLNALERELGVLRGAPEGQRNHQLNESAFSLFQLVEGGELDEGLVIDRLTSVARGIGLEEKEIRATIGSGRRAGSELPRTAPVKPQNLGVVSSPDLVAEGETARPRLLQVRTLENAVKEMPPRPESIFQDFLARGEVMVIGAGRAYGKSQFAMNAAYLASQGQGALVDRFKVMRETKVLYCQGEVNPWLSSQRWFLMGGLEVNHNMLETFDRFRISVYEATEIRPDGTTKKAFRAESPEELEATIAELGIELLIIDPFKTYYGGGENSNDEVEMFVSEVYRLARKYDMAVLMTHHISKAVNVAEPEDLWRGASRLADGVDHRITFLPYYTPSKAQELGMTRQEARSFIKVTTLSRGEPIRPWDMRMNWNTGFWEFWDPSLSKGNAAAQVDSQLSLTPEELAEVCGIVGGFDSQAEAVNHFRGHSRSNVQRALNVALSDGLIDAVQGESGRGGPRTRYVQRKV